MEVTGKLNPKIRELLEGVCIKNGWGTTDEDLVEVLIESNAIWSELGNSHRWYDEKIIVVNLDDTLIQYDWYHLTGDNSVQDMGLAFNLSSAQLCEPYQVSITKYRPVKIDD